ncbi:MAG: FecR domain-containing protein [Cyclobacteriaceae bacterium]
MNTKNQPQLSDAEMGGLWKEIDRNMLDTIHPKAANGENRVIPLHSLSTLERGDRNTPTHKNVFDSYNFRVACILFLAFGLGFLSSWYFSSTTILEATAPQLVYVEHKTVPGVKSHLTLSDGSQVILNSGSKLKYVQNFEKDRREVHLKGEALFNVAKDTQRPFIVNSRGTQTTALGTSFNIKAYYGETLDISLLTGKVAVNREGLIDELVTLSPGEALKIDTEKDQLGKSGFDKDLVIGWTKKRIIFQETPLIEAIRVLENWYGVQISIKNKPVDPVLLSGKFQEETLENVLEGLRFSARFDFEIDKEKVKIIF